MSFEPWMLAAMEAEGITDTKEGHINRVAKELSKSPNSTIDTEKFCSACRACGVDPYSFSSDDLARLQKKLNDW